MKKHKFVLTVEETMFNNTFKDEFIVETDSLAEAYTKCYEYINAFWCGPDAWVNDVTYVGEIE